MPARPPSRPVVLRVVGLLGLVGLVAAAVVSGSWVLSHRSSDPAAASGAVTGELMVQASSAGASVDASGLHPLSGEVAALVPGEQSWVEIPWTSDASVCAVSVTVAAHGATVAYPWTTKAFSSFSRESRLAAAGKDYTAVRVQLPESTTTSTLPADVTATFTTNEGTSAGSCTGSTTTRTYRITLPVRT